MLPEQSCGDQKKRASLIVSVPKRHTTGMKIPWYLRNRTEAAVVVGLGGLLTTIPLVEAQPWAAGGAPPTPYNTWRAVAASADAVRLVAVVHSIRYCYGSCPPSPLALATSADGGATWKLTVAPANLWQAVASSADGVKLVAAAAIEPPFTVGDGLIYASGDSGKTWAPTTAPPSWWQAVASSADGTRLVAASDRIYSSSDGGATWVETSAPVGDWTSLASSADGTRLAAVAQWSQQNGAVSPGAIFTSRDSGATWLQTAAPSNNWIAVVCSADGIKLAAAATGYWENGTNLISGAIYTSADSGATWVQRSAPGTNWTAIASSADGTRLVASSDWQTFTSADSGATWTATDAPGAGWLLASSADGYSVVAATGNASLCRLPYLGPWRLAEASHANLMAVATSADGTKLVAGAQTYNNNGANNGPIYTSADSGATWTATSAPTNYMWSSVASSSDGTRLVASANSTSQYLAGGGVQTYNYGPIVISTDSGASWRGSGVPLWPWASVASSADGTVLAAAASANTAGNWGYGQVFVSTNSGATWTRTTAPLAGWSGIAASADGAQLVAVSWQDPFGNLGRIYLSTNSGFSWIPTGAPSNSWSAVAASADGRKLAAASSAGDGLIYLSTNSGVSWTASSAPSTAWSSISCSADGAKVAAVATRWPFLPMTYLSTDSGETWVPANAPAGDWQAVACAASGSNVAVVGGSLAATLRTPSPAPPLPPSPPLVIGLSKEKPSLSWLLPSTSFVLQQSSDLTAPDWVDVTNRATLNFTNLHQEVTLSPSSGKAFYRLKQ